MTNKIETLRLAVDAKRAELVAVENAGLPENYVRKLIGEQLEVLAGGYHAGVNRAARLCLGVRDRAELSLHRAFGLSFDSQAAAFLIGAIAAHLGDQIAADISARMKEINGDFPPQLAEAERDKLIAELKRELRALERREEAEIETAEAHGLPVLRRADADPIAVLAVPDSVASGAGL